MKLIKSAAIACTLALSMSSFAVSAEVCLGMACMYNRMTPIEGINATLGQINEAQEAIIKLSNSGGAADNGKAGNDAIIENIKEALKLSKEINANDKLDRNRNRANGYLKKAREAIQAGNLALAADTLKEADKRFSELKGMIDLTQEDRISQQTNLLNRITNTADTAAGARK
jgi:Spy/CpxP family protein refolding chaperone